MQVSAIKAFEGDHPDGGSMRILVQGVVITDAMNGKSRIEITTKVRVTRQMREDWSWRNYVVIAPNGLVSCASGRQALLLGNGNAQQARGHMPGALMHSPHATKNLLTRRCWCTAQDCSNTTDCLLLCHTCPHLCTPIHLSGVRSRFTLSTSSSPH